MPRRALFTLLIVSTAPACDKVESNFVLRLEARAPLDQRPFDADASVKLILRDDLGTEVLLLDDGDDGLVRDHLPPIDDAWLGVLLEDPPSSQSSYDPEALFAWGEIGPFDLARGEEIDAPILVAEFGAVGDLDLLATSTGTVGSALAVTPEGDAWIFGGADAWNPTSTLGLARQLRLTDLDGGNWRFEDAGTMPSVLGASARFEPTASLVEAEDGPGVLVVGGRANGASEAGNLATAFLLDTASATVTWSGPTPVARSGHRALVLDNGRVLTVGGLEGEQPGEEPEQASFEVFDPTWLAFDAGGERLDVPARSLAVASLGPDGALVCGGWQVGEPGPGPDRSPVTTCQRVSLLGNVQDAADLPVALADLAMAGLPDGTALACGGVLDPLDGDPVDATDRAWIYDVGEDEWVEIDPLASARARHQAIPTPDGRVVILGGTDAVGPDLYDNGEPVECVEIYDPGQRTFTEVECTGTGAGAWPLVAPSPRGVAVTVSGWAADGTTGRGYGVVGLGPDL